MTPRCWSRSSPSSSQHTPSAGHRPLRANEHGQPVLYAIVTGSPAARDVGKLVDLAQDDRWDVCVIASPNGYQFINADILTAKTGHTMRHHYKEPDAPDVLPPADAMMAAPITCNSLTFCATGWLC